MVAPLSSIIARLQELAANGLKGAHGRRGPSKWIGLDLGSASIKLIELEEREGRFSVTNRLIQELPAGQEEPVDRAGWLQAALKEFGTSAVHVAISGPEVAIRRVRVPPMSSQELKEAVRWMVKDELPFAVQDAVISCRVVGEVWDKDIRKLDVLVAAVAMRALQEQIRVVEKAGASVASMVPACAALWRGISDAYPEKLAASSVAVVEIGAEQTHAVILKDGVPRVARDLPIGSRHFTQALIGAIASEGGEIQVDAAKAEQIKRQYGIIPETSDGTTEEGVPLGQLAALMRSVLETLLIELARFLDFYKVQMHEAGVSRILLCGGGANLKHLRAFLEEGLGVAIELYDPLCAAAPLSEPINELLDADGDSRLAVAFGAAVGHGQELDCTPPEVKTRQIQDRAAGLFRQVSIGAPFLIGALYLLMQLVAWSGQRQARSLERTWEALRPAHEEAVQMAADTARLEAIARTVSQLSDRQPLLGAVMRELGALVPGNVELTELTVAPSGPSAQGTEAGAIAKQAMVAEEVLGAGGGKGSELRLRGTVWPQRDGQDAGLSGFLEAMERSVFFKDVRLSSSQVQSSPLGTTWFELQCRLE